MEANTYQKLAMRVAKDECHKLSNVGLGIAGEAGEVADAIKKHLHQGHPLNKEKIAEELGDVCWYIALGCSILGYSFDEILKMNIEKLNKRYPNGFESERSINRDKQDFKDWG